MTADEKTAFDAAIKVKQDAAKVKIAEHRTKAGYDTMTEEQKLAFDKDLVKNKKEQTTRNSAFQKKL